MPEQSSGAWAFNAYFRDASIYMEDDAPVLTSVDAPPSGVWFDSVGQTIAGVATDASA